MKGIDDIRREEAEKIKAGELEEAGRQRTKDIKKKCNEWWDSRPEGFEHYEVWCGLESLGWPDELTAGSLEKEIKNSILFNFQKSGKKILNDAPLLGYKIEENPLVGWKKWRLVKRRK